MENHSAQKPLAERPPPQLNRKNPLSSFWRVPFNSDISDKYQVWYMADKGVLKKGLWYEFSPVCFLICILKLEGSINLELFNKKVMFASKCGSMFWLQNRLRDSNLPIVSNCADLAPHYSSHDSWTNICFFYFALCTLRLSLPGLICQLWLEQ